MDDEYRGQMHQYLYADPKRVARARVQAEGRIALRRLSDELWALFHRPLFYVIYFGAVAVVAVSAGLLTGWQ